MATDMKRKKPHIRRADRHISVRGVQRDEPDLRKLGRALIVFAAAQAEADAQQQDEAQRPAAEPEDRAADD